MCKFDLERNAFSAAEDIERSNNNPGKGVLRLKK